MNIYEHAAADRQRNRQLFRRLQGPVEVHTLSVREAHEMVQAVLIQRDEALQHVLEYTNALQWWRRGWLEVHAAIGRKLRPSWSMQAVVVVLGSVIAAGALGQFLFLVYVVTR